MAVFSSTIQSPTGSLIYSDAHMTAYNLGFLCPDEGAKLSMLNRFAKIPVVGILAGLTRAVIAVVHIIFHLAAALFTWNAEHLPHALKGLAELGRGLIEATPIAGRLFANLYDPYIGALINTFTASDAVSGQASDRLCYNFFLVKIRDPNNADPIDTARDLQVLADARYEMRQILGVQSEITFNDEQKTLTYQRGEHTLTVHYLEVSLDEVKQMTQDFLTA